MSENALISVIVPVYNVEKYLDACIKSIIEQTYTNIEIILINDGSTDKSGGICYKYSQMDERIRYYNRNNSGVAVTRNFGVKVSNGEYIVFVDSDDCVLPEYVNVLYNYIRQTKCGIVQCSLTTFVNTPQLEYIPSDICEIVDSLEYLTRTNIPGCSTLWSKIYHRELFRDIRFPDGKIHEDIAVIYKLIDKCDKIAIISDKLYCYRYNPSGITKKKIDLARIDIIDVLFEEAMYYKEKGYTDLFKIKSNDVVKNISGFFAIEKALFVDAETFEMQLLSRYLSIRGEILKMPINMRMRFLVLLSRKSLFPFKIVTRIKKVLIRFSGRCIGE